MSRTEENGNASALRAPGNPATGPSDAQHTKGPWRLQIVGNQEADLISGGTFMGLTGGSGAPDKYEPDDAAEWLANARLIAAAPCLLKALSELLDAFECEPDDLMPHEYEAIVADAKTRARAAIARATKSEVQS